jgi:exopolysaccharide production protein ExoZ
MLSLKRRLAEIYELPNTAQRISSMEGTRGLAVLLVFFVHFHALFSGWDPVGSVVSYVSHFMATIGHSGVDLFFVLSGYLIYAAVIGKQVSYFAFVKRRAQRIYPAFLCAFAIYLILSFLFPSKSKLPSGILASVFYVIQNVLFLPGMFSIRPIITVAWSLSYEFFYYLSIPLVVRFTGMRRWAARWRVVFFVFLILLYTTGSLFFGLPRFRLTMFLAGIVVYEALRWPALTSRLSTAWEIVATALVTSSFGLVYLLGLPEEYGGLPVAQWHGYTLRALVLLVSFPVFSLFCFGRRGLLWQAFNGTPLRWLGNISYSFYLVHGLTLQALVMGLGLVATVRSVWVFCTLFVVGLAASTMVATLLYVTVERPLSLARRPARRVC